MRPGWRSQPIGMEKDAPWTQAFLAFIRALDVLSLEQLQSCALQP